VSALSTKTAEAVTLGGAMACWPNAWPPNSTSAAIAPAPREAGEPAALFSSLRRQGADHRGLITERSRGTEAAWKERRVDFLRTIIF